MWTAHRQAFRPYEAPSNARIFAGLFDGFYRNLLDQGVPEHLAQLVRQLDDTHVARPTAFVVQRGLADRRAATALLDRSGLSVEQSDTVDDALLGLRQLSDVTAFLFVDQTVSQVDDGLVLANTAATLWPTIRVVVTLDDGNEPVLLPDGVVTVRKPWREADIASEAATAARMIKSAA